MLWLTQHHKPDQYGIQRAKWQLSMAVTTGGMAVYPWEKQVRVAAAIVIFGEEEEKGGLKHKQLF